MTSCIKHSRVMCISLWHHASNTQEWRASLGDIMHQTPKSDVHLSVTSCIKRPRVMCISRWHHASNAQEWCASLGDIMHQTPKSDVHLIHYISPHLVYVDIMWPKYIDILIFRGNDSTIKVVTNMPTSLDWLSEYTCLFSLIWHSIVIQHQN